MEPLSALSIAAAVIQFVDFTSSLLKEYREIRQAGQPLTFEAFEQTSNDILKLNESLKKSTRSKHATASATLTEHEQALRNISQDCSKIAQELVDALQSLKPKKIDRAEAEELAKAGKETYRCKWTNFRQALRTVWKAEHIETLKARLSTHREELVLRVLTCLNAKTDVYHSQQCELLDALGGGQARIVEVLAFNRGEVRQLKKDLDDAMDVIKRNHGEVLAAIVTMSDGRTRSIIPGSATPQQFSANYEQSTLRIGQTKDGSETIASLAPFSYTNLHQKLLNCLYFRQIRDRVDDVRDAHKSTFRWIFHNPDGVTQTWSDLANWLESKNGVYWINGKAGSGKSTLMKFILEEAQTWTHLSKWAGGTEMVAASFFFWNLGTPLQKTQEGLLRSLLHDVLERHPELIPVVMPELCKEASISPHSHGIDEPNLAQLKRWFSRLSRYANSSCRLFFHIDGLDEYEGDPVELVDLISNAAAENVKFLVSSRPITACTDAFASVPGLRLHDLTRDDMTKYCNSVLGKYLKREVSEEKLMLIDELVEKSSGVFLWLVLVAKSILQGLQDGDTIRELRDRLEELPTDLAELYAHMIRRIPTKYRPQASEIFQVYESSRSVEQGIRGHPILAIQLSFIGEHWDDVLTTPCKPLSRKQEKARVDDIDRRIRSRCYGLLEIQKRKTRRRVKSLAERVLATSRVVRPHVDFIHRTVVEFLRDEKVWAEIKSWTEADPYHGLFKTCIMMTKSFAPSDVVHPRASLVWESMYTGLRYAQLAEHHGRPLAATHLNTFDQVLSIHWDEAQEYYQDYIYTPVSSKHWSRLFFCYRNHTIWDSAYPDEQDFREESDSFRSLPSPDPECHELIEATDHLGIFRVAIIYGLGSFLWVKLMKGTAQQLTDLLSFWLELQKSSFPVRLKQPCTSSLSFYLLDAGIKASDRLDEKDAFTLWNLFLNELCYSKDMANFNKEQAEESAKLARRLLEMNIGDRSWTPDMVKYGKLLAPYKPMFKEQLVPELSDLFDTLEHAVSVQEERSRSNTLLDGQTALPRSSNGSSSTSTQSSVTTTDSTPATSVTSARPQGSTSPEMTSIKASKPQTSKSHRLSQMFKKARKRLRLPLARWRADWRAEQHYDTLDRMSDSENESENDSIANAHGILYGHLMALNRHTHTHTVTGSTSPFV